MKDFSPQNQTSKQENDSDFSNFSTIVTKKKFYEDYCKMNRVLKKDEEKLNFKVMTRNLQIYS